MPLVRDEHDGASSSGTVNANVENSGAAAATDLKNSSKITNMRLLLAIRNASTAAAETLTGDSGLAETAIIAPFGCAAAHIAPPLPRRALRDGRCQWAIALQ